MTKRYEANWEMDGIGKDEQAYLRGLIKLLVRLGALREVPTGSQVSCRNKIEGFVAVIPRADKLIREHGFTPPTARDLANGIMGIVNEELL